MKKFVFAALMMGAAAAHGGSMGAGVYVDNSAQEERLSFGPGDNYTQLRQSLKIPAEYGKLVWITPHGDSAALWFEAADGALRNVVVPQDKLVLIRRAPALK